MSFELIFGLLVVVLLHIALEGNIFLYIEIAQYRSAGERILQ